MLEHYSDWLAYHKDFKTRLSPDIFGVENFGSSISGRGSDCLETGLGLPATGLDFDTCGSLCDDGGDAVGGGKADNNSIRTLLFAFIQLSRSFDGMLLNMFSILSTTV